MNTLNKIGLLLHCTCHVLLFLRLCLCFSRYVYYCTIVLMCICRILIKITYLLLTYKIST